MSAEEEHERSENERWYDEEIAPVLKDLAERCCAQEMNFFAAVEYEPGSRAETRKFANDSLAMKLLSMCCAAGTNIDGYLIGIMRYCKKKGIDIGSSIFLGRYK